MILNKLDINKIRKLELNSLFTNEDYNSFFVCIHILINITIYK